MKKFRLVFFAAFFLYHLAVLIMVIFINMNAEDIGFLLAMHDRISMLFYGATLGLIMYFINVGLVYLHGLRYEKIIESKDKKIMELKAKLYDQMSEQQETEKSTVEIPTSEDDQKEA